MAVYENADHEGDEAVATRAAAQKRERIGHQLRDIDQLEGTYPFTLEVSVRAYRINRTLHQLCHRGPCARP